MVWSEVDTNPIVHSFTAPSRPTAVLPPQARPVDFFNLVFGFAWAIRVAQTNLYAEYHNAANWVAVTEPEMKAFMGILVIMGIIRLPVTDLYWSIKFSCLRNTTISSVMARDRFEEILRYPPFSGPKPEQCRKPSCQDRQFGYTAQWYISIYMEFGQKLIHRRDPRSMQG